MILPSRRNALGEKSGQLPNLDAGNGERTQYSRHAWPVAPAFSVCKGHWKPPRSKNRLDGLGHTWRQRDASAPAPYGQGAPVPRDNHTQFRNRLLSAFAQDDLEQFFSDLHPESILIRQTIYSEGGLMEHVYFVEEGLASVLKGMENGSTIEVGMIGIECMIGMPALLGAEISAH